MVSSDSNDTVIVNDTMSVFSDINNWSHMFAVLHFGTCLKVTLMRNTNTEALLSILYSASS